MAIGSVEVISDNLAAWGVTVNDYTYNGKNVDFQDLMVAITEKRAASVEKEVTPMSTRMTTRNTQLDYLGDALAIISSIEAQFTSDDTSSKTSSTTLDQSAVNGFEMVGLTATVGQTLSLNKANADYYQQLLKTKMDTLNNAASKDTTRLQSVVDKRDEAYSTATTLMESISDTRSNTIKNM